MKLIYHNHKKINDVSPFDDALLTVSTNANPLYLASPYIGLNVLSRILENATEWKLISDIEAWLSSGNRKHRAKCWAFIIQNLDRIKHLPDLHAKVAIGNGYVFLGSANFTDKGILNRTEMSVLIDDSKLVTESSVWFEELWNIANPPIINEGDALVKALNELHWTLPTSRVKLSSTAPKVKSILNSSKRPTGFDAASTFALASIAESAKLLPLEEAYASISEKWFNLGIAFTFQQLWEAVNVLNTNSSKHDLWSLVINETVNHWLGGIYQEGFDRYVYINNYFVKWESKYLDFAKKNDSFLNFIIDNFKFSPNYSSIPFDDKWLNNGIPVHQIMPLMSELIKSGFLIEIDIAGDLEQYSIEPNFEWPKRWIKYHTAHLSYIAKQNSNQSEITSEIPDDFFNDDFHSTESDYRANLVLVKSLQLANKKNKVSSRKKNKSKRKL